jgi:hypothetical protein
MKNIESGVGQPDAAARLVEVLTDPENVPTPTALSMASRRATND